QWFLLHHWAVSRPQVAGLFGEPVCNHLQLQKTWQDLGAVETGLEVALMPAEAYDREKSGPGRVACLTAYLPVKSRPHRIYLPQVYTEALTFFYRNLIKERSFAPSVEPLPKDRPTRYQTRVFDFASIVRVTFQDIGFDLEACLEEIEGERRNRNLQVVQVFLKLGCPWIGAAVEVLRDKGYFLGGVLPRWFDEDGLLMQKLFCPPDWEEIQLYSDRAREILRIVRADRDRVTGQEGLVG
ncbi:MAG: acyl carrier protein, partial [Desulfobacca sp.]|nr:acyl carrier protein [Desulfobacca sp.]